MTFYSPLDHEKSGSVASTAHYHSPSVVCFVLLSFSHYASHFSFSLLSYPFLSCVHLSTHFFFAPSLYGFALERFWASQIFKPFHNSVVIWPPKPSAPPSQPPTQRLPLRHSANLSPWNLSNSPCTHSAVPLMSYALHPPLLHFLALSALAA